MIIGLQPREMMKTWNLIFISMRPTQWYKNIILLVGLVFSGSMLNYPMWSNIVLAFIFFCMLSAGEYLVNDILDRERDRKHPVKCKRPIASGSLKVSHALLAAILLILIALLGAYLTINIKFLLASTSYILLILAYSLILKHLVIVDVLVISIGFVLRAVAGCLAISVAISPWLIICVFMLALFLGLAKRRHELIPLNGEIEAPRNLIKVYSSTMLDQMINITLATLIMAYSMYTFLVDNYDMMITVPFVIYGLFRYLFLVNMKNFGSEAGMVFRDKGMLLCITLWAVLIVMILYGGAALVTRFVGRI